MEMVRPDGIYLLHDTLQIFIYIGPNASHELLQQLFPSVDPSQVPSLELAHVSHEGFTIKGKSESHPRLAAVHETRKRFLAARVEHYRMVAGQQFVLPENHARAVRSIYFYFWNVC
jgi:hypothetical protein